MNNDNINQMTADEIKAAQTEMVKTVVIAFAVRTVVTVAVVAGLNYVVKKMEEKPNN